MKIFKFNGAGNVIKNVSANVSGNLKKAIEPVPKLGAGKIASIWDAERSLKTQPNWVFGEALRRSYAPKDAARLSRMSFGTGSILNSAPYILRAFVLAFIVLTAGILASCSRKTTALRVGIMSDFDSVPFMLARDEGFFKDENIDVQLSVFANAQERDAALQAGGIDGAVSDILAAVFFKTGGFDFKITSRTDGRYGIALKPDSDIKSLDGLDGKKIGLSVHTIIHYTVDAQLAESAVPNYEAVVIPRIPLRLQMLLEGQIEAASFPEPFLTAAVSQGAVLLSTTDETGLDPGILLFHSSILEERLDDLKAFYRAYYRAAQKINENPDSYRDYLVERAGFPEAVRDSFEFFQFQEPRLPQESQIRLVIDWMKSRDLINEQIDASALLDGRAVQ